MMMLLIPAAFLVAIGVLVSVHEFGHYWVAKRLGFKVLRFSIGFGKPLLSRIGKDPDRTEYCVAAIPLGGYVKLLDEREGEVDPAELHRSFTRRPVAHRVAVLLAGPAMNLLFASLLYAIVAFTTFDIETPVVGEVRAGGPAAAAGLQPDDVIVRVGDRRIEDIGDLEIGLIREVTRHTAVPLRVRREGAERDLSIPLGEDRRSLTEPGKLLSGLGFDLASDTVIRDVQAGGAGDKAGLLPGDIIEAVDGRPVTSQHAFVDQVSAAGGRDLTLEVGRAGAHRSLVAHVPQVVEQGKPVGRLNVHIEQKQRVSHLGEEDRRRLGPFEALGRGFAKTWDTSSLTVEMLGRIVTGQVSPKNISGPINIAESAGASAYLGPSAFLTFLAIISVSLGVLNLMPVPLLDGGQIVYQLAEAVKGSPLSERTQLFGQQLGIALLVLLMSLAFYNDISRHFN